MDGNVFNLQDHVENLVQNVGQGLNDNDFDVNREYITNYDDELKAATKQKFERYVRNFSDVEIVRLYKIIKKKASQLENEVERLKKDLFKLKVFKIEKSYKISLEKGFKDVVSFLPSYAEEQYLKHYKNVKEALNGLNFEPLQVALRVAARLVAIKRCNQTNSCEAGKKGLNKAIVEYEFLKEQFEKIKKRF